MKTFWVIFFSHYSSVSMSSRRCCQMKWTVFLERKRVSPFQYSLRYSFHSTVLLLFNYHGRRNELISKHKLQLTTKMAGRGFVLVGGQTSWTSYYNLAILLKSQGKGNLNFISVYPTSSLVLYVHAAVIRTCCRRRGQKNRSHQRSYMPEVSH